MPADFNVSFADSELTDRVRRFPAARVLILGDVMLDRYVSGDAHRLSPEAPIPVLRPLSTRSTLGGAANVALNVAALGGKALLVGVVGDDRAGADIQRLLEENTAICARLVSAPHRPTTVKTRFMASAHQLLRLDEETNEPLGSTLESAVLTYFADALQQANIVVLSDYAKGVLCDTVLRGVLELAAAQGCRVIADPKRHDLVAYRGATILTPNENEVRIATHIEVEHDAEADRAGRAALAAAEVEAVLVTRSAKGLTLVRREGPTLHLPTRAREIADVSGAGDTLIAALATALAAGASLPEAATLGNLTAGISVGKQGTATVAAQELLAALHLESLVGADHKTTTRDQAIQRVATWRSNRLRIGFANGCFDLIHPGHVRLLTEARAACDRLIVALNTDNSVRRLKGPTRPVQSENTRATVMASMASVDLVVTVRRGYSAEFN